MDINNTFSVVNIVSTAEYISKATSAAGLAVFGIEYILTFPAEIALYACKGRNLAKILVWDRN
ncbi:hypothetical protein K437DRAFT_268009 [Tilletiaria anomala UBC 951]|uniref:Uncharacterized protein n=1 Tax=Tilletiaria anomala (strain ATCC 24038 / CBS 436.72 / UBC 951) TaxID=1037660 RepID=A0A066VZ82_TILAU|nr:uncharacterized protein K437DRAFT_268009 [Tilletiaria anomala UBC 951]KDN46786.1 hypothetical protein K437DRAFT_268009 [Tilletiaria anomala UBC 951]